jgi:hypothetical protein
MHNDDFTVISRKDAQLYTLELLSKDKNHPFSLREQKKMPFKRASKKECRLFIGKELKVVSKLD